MKNIGHYKLVAALCLVLAVAPTARAANQEIAALDMALLTMFYDDKELVATPTRTAKPVTQVAENIVVITAEEIEKMRARNLAEVLRRIPGVLMLFDGEDYGSPSQVSILGAPAEQVLVLVDNIPWNPLSDAIARLSTIPVHAIDRLEIIKGPASSSWGSALGGVINVMTKSGSPTGFGGAAGFSVGKASSHDLYADFRGGADGFRFYLFAGRQGSAGLDPKRQYDFNSVLAKVAFPIADGTTLSFSSGYSNPVFHETFASFGFASDIPNPTLWLSAVLETTLTHDIAFTADAYHLVQDIGTIFTFVDASGAPLGMPPLEFTEKNRTSGLRLRSVWTGRAQTLVAGLDYRQGELKNNVPEEADIEEWALYLNDTLLFGRFSVTPGIRFDAIETAENVVSPSLGLTFRAGTDTILRLTAGRGFFAPPPGRFFTGSTTGMMPAPGLKPETTWAVSGGVESLLFDLVRAKATGFYFNQKDSLDFTGAVGQNTDDVETYGADLELQSEPVYHFSFNLGLSYLDRQHEDDPVNYIQKIVNLGLIYDHPALFRAEIFGHYLRPDYEPTNFANRDTRHYDDIIWDASVSRRLELAGGAGADVFVVVRNITSGDQFHTGTFQNPGIWAEGGLRLHY